MDSFGNKIRNLRHEKKLPLRIVAAYLNIDQAILCKIEKGQRKANREQVIKLAEFFEIKANDLLLSWLSDNLVYEIANEDLALQALQVAEDKIEYLVFRKTDRNDLIKKIQTTLRQFVPIEKAWIYGSFARKEDGPKSDIDIALQTDSTFSYFDLAELQYVLENSLNRKVDVGFIDAFKPYILESLTPDLKLVYEK